MPGSLRQAGRRDRSDGSDGWDGSDGLHVADSAAGADPAQETPPLEPSGHAVPVRSFATPGSLSKLGHRGRGEDRQLGGLSLREHVGELAPASDEPSQAAVQCPSIAPMTWPIDISDGPCASWYPPSEPRALRTSPAALSCSKIRTRYEAGIPCAAAISRTRRGSPSVPDRASSITAKQAYRALLEIFISRRSVRRNCAGLARTPKDSAQPRPAPRPRDKFAR